MKGWIKRLMVFITTGRYNLFEMLKTEETRKDSMKYTNQLSAELRRMRHKVLDEFSDPARTITRAINGSKSDH